MQPPSNPGQFKQLAAARSEIAIRIRRVPLSAANLHRLPPALLYGEAVEPSSPIRPPPSVFKTAFQASARVQRCPRQMKSQELGSADVSLTVADVRKIGCQPGCQDLCLLQTHGPEPSWCRILKCPSGSGATLLNSNNAAFMS